MENRRWHTWTNGGVTQDLITRRHGSNRRDRANGRVSETLGKAAQGSASLGRVRLPNIQASSNATCRRHGAKIRMKLCGTIHDWLTIRSILYCVSTKLRCTKNLSIPIQFFHHNDRDNSSNFDIHVNKYQHINMYVFYIWSCMIIPSMSKSIQIFILTFNKIHFNYLKLGINRIAMILFFVTIWLRVLQLLRKILEYLWKILWAYYVYYTKYFDILLIL